MCTKVSVIIPVYNAGEHIKPCLESLINQTLKEIEIICVLDCPTDGTDKVVESYAQKDERVKIIKNKKNLHTGFSRNEGIEAAQGEYIGFSDDDDLSDPDMYERLYLTAKAKNVKYCTIGFDIKDEVSVKREIEEQDTWNINYLWEDLFSSANLSGNGLIWHQIYDRNFINQHNIRFVDTKIYGGEDRIFACQLLAILKHEKEETACVKEIRYHHILLENSEGHKLRYQKNCDLGLIYLINWAQKKMGEDWPATKKELTKMIQRQTFRTLHMMLKVNDIKGVLTYGRELKKMDKIKELILDYPWQYTPDITIAKNINFWIWKAYLTVFK